MDVEYLDNDYCASAEPAALDLSLEHTVDLRVEITKLQKQIEEVTLNSKFCLERFAASAEDIWSYTGGTGVYYQAMPAVGPDGKNVMKLIPVQKVNGQFYQTPFTTDRDNADLQLKAYANPVHPPTASSSQIQPRLPSLQPTADGRYVLKTLPEVRVLSNPVGIQQGGGNNLINHSPKQVHVPPQMHSISQYTVQLPQQPNQKSITAVQTLPVTVKSPVLPNGHFLQIPPNAKVRTMPATALPQSIKCRIMNSVSNTPNPGKTPTVVLVTPVDSVKQVDCLTKPIQAQNTLSLNPPANLQTPACVPKTSEVNTPIKWVVQEGTGATAPCLIPLSTPNVNSDSIKTVKHAISNEVVTSKPTPAQTGQEKFTPGKDNALVMCNGKVYFVAKKNSEIAKDVMISEGGKRGFVSTSPALPASSALATNSSKPDPKHNISEVIDLCDDDGETSTCLGGAPGNLPTPSQTEVDESDEESNVIFVSYIPPKSNEKEVNLGECEELAEVSVKAVAKNNGENNTCREKGSDGGSDNPNVEVMDEQVKENEVVERNTNFLAKTVNMEEDKRSSEMRCQDDVTENVSMLELPQNDCIPAPENIEKAFENPAPDQSLQPKSDSQLRKEFGITSDVQISLLRTKPTMMGDQQTERLIINKHTLDGLRKVIQESKLQLKIQQIIQAPHAEMEEDEFLKAKRRKMEHEGSLETTSSSTINISTGSDFSPVLMGSHSVSNNCQEEVCSPIQSGADKDHMLSETAEDCSGDTCCLSSTLKQKAPQTAVDLLPPIPARTVPPRSKKGKVCTACPCGTILGTAETISSQKKTNLCTVDNSNKVTKPSCVEKEQGESLQPPKHFVKKTTKKLSSGSTINSIAPLESETSFDIASSTSLSSSLPQPELSSVQTDCSNTDAKRSQQDTSQAETTLNYPCMPLLRKPPGPKMDKFPIQELYTSEALDAEEIKRLERIKRLKDLLKEKEAALEQMQRNMNV